MSRRTRLATSVVVALVLSLPAAADRPAKTRPLGQPAQVLVPPAPAPPWLGPPGEGRPPAPACPECPVPVVYGDPSADCPDWQWIGIVAPAEERRQGRIAAYEDVESCPLPPGDGWSARHLFCPSGAAAPAGAGGGAPDPRPPAFPLPADCDPAGLPAALRPFCLYRHEDRGGDLAALEVPGLLAVGRDCAAVGALSGEAGELVRFTLAERQAHFLAQAGGPPIAAAGAGAPVRLALVDTSPTSRPGTAAVEPSSLHGRTLLSLAGRLLDGAGGGAGSVALAERLALAYLRFDRSSRRLALRDEARGGFFGTFGDLAQAIREEVAAWPAAGGAHLVLNLSVGWQRALGGLEGDVAAMPAPVQAIHRAIEDARCRGALVFAAAGNRTWGPELGPNLGALLPAAWEARPAPDRAACEAAVAPETPDLADAPDGAGRPLVHAVGGVEADGRPLGSSRAAFGGEPRLVAFADHAVVERSDRAGRPTAVLTGSSVAAAVASAVAAAQWSVAGDLDAFALVERLYANSAGEDLGRPAGFCRGAGDGGCASTVRRLSLRSVRGDGSARRSAPAAPPPLLRIDSAGSPAFASALVLDGSKLPKLPATASPDCPPAAIAEALRGAGEAAGERFRPGGGSRAALFPCPRWQLPDVSVRPATVPQPESSPCTGCGFEENSPGTVYLEIDPDFGGRISSPVLYVGADAYALPDLARTPRLKIENLEAGPDDRLFLSVVVDGARSATVPLLRVRRR